MDAPSSGFFDGFALDYVDTGEVVLRVRHGGSGPPVLLLHGHPRTHTTWYAVAPQLAARYTVVCADLRGYGQSSAPPQADGSAGMSKRAMARDALALMTSLGHERFTVVGHDRGCYAALRTALDYPDRIERLAVLDGVPIIDALERCDEQFARAWWHWFFLGQTGKPAEEWINRDPQAWYRGDRQTMGEENYTDWVQAINDPETVRCMVEDYRAGLAEDREHDERDRQTGRQVQCPTVFAYSLHDDMQDLYGEPSEIWHRWAPELQTAVIDSGHHMAEEAPRELANVLLAFLDSH